MSRSTDPGHFFQTDASEATRARRAAKSGNKNGDPIVLQSKILGVILDPFSPNSVYTAESTGCVRKIDLTTKDGKTVYRGPTAPVTSIAIGGSKAATIFAGCWDKDVWSWDRSTRSLGMRYKGHSDFVKTIICTRLEDRDILISGGADSKIIVWDTATGQRLHTLRDKLDTMMALQDLALDPEETTETELVLLSSSSDPQIRRWRISLSSWSQILDFAPSKMSPGTQITRQTILEHETSVYRLLFFGYDEESDLWTASADGTAKCLSRAKNWATEETYQHGDYVRAIVVSEDWVISAGRDEDIKIWDRITGKLWHIYDGHYEEVTGLVVLERDKKLISISIDGTVRSWTLDKEGLSRAKKEKEKVINGKTEEQHVSPVNNLLTAEEEAELAEMMGLDGD